MLWGWGALVGVWCTLSTSALGLELVFPMPPFCYLGLSPKKTNVQLFNILLMISNSSLQERGHQT